LQREASAAAGRYIPMVVENVKGAQPWVGRAAWNYGSFYLWGDLPALMPSARSSEAVKAPGLGAGWVHPDDPRHTPGLDFTRIAGKHADGTKNTGGSWFNIAHNTTSGCAQNPDGRKRPGIKFSEEGFNCTLARELAPTLKRGAVKLSAEDKRQHLSSARKAASAKIAKIPLALSSHIARVYRPERIAA
jgi:hypothetical protein